jgi:hypothetical protein
VSDPYADAAALSAMLRARHMADWATQIDDVIAAGATATEILMGIRWVVQKLLADAHLDAALDKQARELVASIDLLLSVTPRRSPS